MKLPSSGGKRQSQNYMNITDYKIKVSLADTNLINIKKLLILIKSILI